MATRMTAEYQNIWKPTKSLELFLNQTSTDYLQVVSGLKNRVDSALIIYTSRQTNG